jgi:NADH-quinone oxidoreductase subunit E
MLKVIEQRLELTPEQLLHLETSKKNYPEGKHKSALIPMLMYFQDLNNNWLSTPVMDQLAELLDITPIEVYEVATFYSMFNLKPVGKYLLEVCRTGPCMLVGSDTIIDYIKQKLNINEGETTADGMFTLKCVECLGACGYAPMMQVGTNYHEHLTEEKIDELLQLFRDKSTRLN